MLSSQIKEKEILANLIAVFNLFEQELRDLLKELELNCLEFSILVYISKNEVTQYRIAKKYKVSVQRVHQIVRTLLGKNYIKTTEEIKNGRIIKNLICTLKLEKIEEINDKIIKKFKEKNIKSKNLKDFNQSLKFFIEHLE